MRPRAIGIALAVACLGATFWALKRPSPPEQGSGAQDSSSPGATSALTAPETAPSPPTPPPKYVGSAACSSCHKTQADAHRGSDHDRAIEVPSEASILAPFAGETFAHDGTTSTFHKDGEKYLVRTLGADGKKQDYPVAYTFGYAPLQQYLLDVGRGRLQSLTVAWDSRPRAAGGQRYFSLYPDERLKPSDELHWSQPSQNWNFTCADCHTTALKKGYDEGKNSFDPSFAELDVSCEACHGPGSAHVAWAGDSQRAPASNDRKGLLLSLARSEWEIPPSSRSAIPRPIGENQKELETCAPCHSRRQQLREGFLPGEAFIDAYLPDLLTAGLYHDDGQIEGEVYEYGSFQQSRMFNSGVRCSDCHDPHSLELRRPGNALCTGCHSEGVFDVPEHHHHRDAGSACVDCHMPQTTYMQVDPRRDHSIRIPRPDLGNQLGTKDACTDCHKTKSQEWAAGQIKKWTGREPPPHYGTAFRAARQHAPGGDRALIGLIRASHLPAIVRGTALSLLGAYPTPSNGELLRSFSKEKDALLHLGVAQAALGFEEEARLPLVKPLLDDPRLGVRTAAARALVGVPLGAVPGADRPLFNLALDELGKVERYNADRADAWLRISLIETTQGKQDQALRSLEHALELDPRFAPALVNLADLHRTRGDEAQTELLLRRALDIDDKNAEAWHALGLCLVRQQRMAEGTKLLKKATELRPDSARMAYVYAVALGDSGDVRDAIAVLRRSLDAHPNDPTLIQTLLNYAHKGRDTELVQEMAERLERLRESQAEARTQ